MPDASPRLAVAARRVAGLAVEAPVYLPIFAALDRAAREQELAADPVALARMRLQERERSAA